MTGMTSITDAPHGYERVFSNGIGVKLKLINGTVILIRRPGEQDWTLYRSFDDPRNAVKYLQYMHMWGGFIEDGQGW